MGELIGYARVSTNEQTLDLQKDALKEAGCQKIFEDVISGSKSERPGLAAALSYMREGDTFVFWKLDRVSRSLHHLLELSDEFERRGVAIRSLQDEIDTSTSMGKFFFHLMGAVAELERDIIRERTRAGLAAARARGRKGGPHHKLSAKQIEMGQSLYDARKHTVAQICQMLGCSSATFYRYIKVTQVPENGLQ